MNFANTITGGLNQRTVDLGNIRTSERFIVLDISSVMHPETDKKEKMPWAIKDYIPAIQR